MDSGKETMNPEIVVSDIDGVLGDVSVPILHTINSRYGMNYVSEDWTDWNTPFTMMALHEPGMDEIAVARFLFSPEHFSQAAPLAAAQGTLQRWAEEGTKIHVATSRHPSIFDTTLAWFEEHYPFVRRENINIRRDNSLSGTAYKQQQVERIQPNLYFEDEGAALEALIAVWPESFQAMIRMIDQPWNRSFTQLDRFRTRWEDIR